MKILVTGGTGHVGRAVVTRLVRNGHQVKVIDRRLGERIDGAEYVECDITDFKSLREQVRGQEAIAHLAAIPYPGGASGDEIFRINCAGTFNVFEATAAEGIRRMACASSINALGYNFGVKGFPIQYFPIDEEHPSFTTDPYSFSKQINEAISAYYWRREGISSTCLRMPGVYGMTEESRWMGREFFTRYRDAFAGLMSLAVAERETRVRQLLSERDAMRAQRFAEKSWGERRRRGEALNFNDPSMLIRFGYTDFWAIISTEDAAQAFEKSLLADYEGSHPLYVNETQNFTSIESETLAQLFFPEVKDRKRPLPGAACLVSFEKARQLIGFEPEYLLGDRLEAS